jgi:tetratricopeptide (TPR) repeat protein
MIRFKRIAAILLAFFSFAATAQPTFINTNSEAAFQKAKSLFDQGQYALAYTEFRDLNARLNETHKTDKSYYFDQVRFYHIACQLQLSMGIAGSSAQAFIRDVNNEPLKHLMSYHLGHYFYQRDEYELAIATYKQASMDNLTNEQIADVKFEQAYCMFQLKEYENSRKLFNEIHQLPMHKYYIPANYYYGVICYMQKDNEAALDCFRLIAADERYNSSVPYYIAEILYATGRKSEALEYSDSVLKQNGASAYRKEMQLLGAQLYFEKKDYQSALPLFEDYVKQRDKVSKQVMYELSYCYYKNNQAVKAIEGFKQLSNEKDSLGQNSMYLLGELYLKQNDKSNARAAFHFCSYNSSNPEQQRISRLNYSKLSYELGFNDVALNEIKAYIRDYSEPNNQPAAIAELAEAKELMIAMLANTNNYDEGLAMYATLQQSSVSAQLSYARLLFGKSIQLLGEQRLEEASNLLSKIVALQANSPVHSYAYFWLGDIAYRQRRYEQAIRYLNTFLDKRPVALGEANVMNANYDLGYCWFQKADYKQSLVAFGLVAITVRANSSAIEQDAYLRSGDCYYMLKNYKAAAGNYDNIISLKLPQADYATLQKAMIAGIGDTQEKLKLLNNVLKLFPQSPLVVDAQMEAALTCIADEKYAEAIPYLTSMLNHQQAVSLKPLIYLKLGLAYHNMNDNKNALVYYKLLLTQYPKSAETDEAVEVLKDIYVSEGQPDAYFELMQSNGIVIKITEADSLSFGAARMKYESGECETALKALDNYLQKFNTGAFALEAYAYKAKCHQQRKETAQAIQSFINIHQKGSSKYFENATLELARLYYLDMKDYVNAKKYFEILSNQAVNPEIKQDALRGLVRSNYQLKDYATAFNTAKELAAMKGSSTDDKAVANLVQAKSLMVAGDTTAAMESFKTAAQLSKTAWGAEARYEIAVDGFRKNDLKTTEKNAMMVIDNYGSYEIWVAKSYLLLGDIFMRQQDYFNAKATYESVVKNTTLSDIKQSAQQKYDAALAAEKQSSKIAN